MTTALLAALRAIFMKLLAGMATEKFLVWVLAFFGETGVRSTKTKRDDEVFLTLLALLDENKANQLRKEFAQDDKVS